MSYNYANASQIFVNPRLRSSGEVEKATVLFRPLLSIPYRTLSQRLGNKNTTSLPLHVALSRPAATTLPADALRLYEPRTWHHPTNLPAHQRMSGRLGCLNIARCSCDYPSIESPASQPDVPNLYPSDRRAF
ncbi:hypothetical protein V8C42DRAFT_128694 [Trichoderma barbatum]